MTPPPTTTVPPYVSLIVRILTLICLLISFIVIATNNQTVSTVAGDVKIKFKDFYAYSIFNCYCDYWNGIYSSSNCLSISLLTTGNRVGGEGFLLFDFYGDKFISYFLVTGAAASFGMTQDLKQLEGSDNYSKFLNTSNAAASLCLIGFFFAVASSIFSSYNLPKRI
ncbi:cASP-like protein PIMP1 isoform X1 [Capsicum galapagoense]